MSNKSLNKCTIKILRDKKTLNSFIGRMFSFPAVQKTMVRLSKDGISHTRNEISALTRGPSDARHQHFTHISSLKSSFLSAALYRRGN